MGCLKIRDVMPQPFTEKKKKRGGKGEKMGKKRSRGRREVEAKGTSVCKTKRKGKRKNTR